ncbi:hypothetical protein [Natrinema caseinilyticum]|uniref:hypothetical protein n=1 Tax=Natrinema caseinilyticum TaxID=2961570 RepID=UPI0020C3BBC6|nr:hypothetical protein [Natrinema caseinilyticum]
MLWLASETPSAATLLETVGPRVGLPVGDDRLRVPSVDLEAEPIGQETDRASRTRGRVRRRPRFGTDDRGRSQRVRDDPHQRLVGRE